MNLYETCNPQAGRCPMGAVAAVLFVIALLAGCGPSTAPPPAGNPPGTSEAQATVTERLSAEEFVAAVQPGDVIVDVRTPAEVSDGRLTGAVIADVSAPGFEAAVAGLDRNATTYVYCRSGNRSARAADIMRSMGFTRVINIGGYADLRAAGAPVEEPGQ